MTSGQKKKNKSENRHINDLNFSFFLPIICVDPTPILKPIIKNQLLIHHGIKQINHLSIRMKGR